MPKIDLEGWEINWGVNFELTGIEVEVGGSLVYPADPHTYKHTHPTVPDGKGFFPELSRLIIPECHGGIRLPG